LEVFLQYHEYHLKTWQTKAQKQEKFNKVKDFLNVTKSLTNESAKTKTCKLSI